MEDVKIQSRQKRKELLKIMETLGKRISENRKAKNLKQDELAEMLLVSPQAVSKWENDISCPDISLLPKLSEILGISGRKTKRRQRHDVPDRCGFHRRGQSSCEHSLRAS